MTQYLKELEAFYIKSQQPHAFSTAEIKKEPNGAKIMHFAEGPWKMVDIFYGGSPYGGCMTVERDGRVVWTQVYYGQVHDTVTDVKIVYDFLRLALRKPSKERPFRGPDSFVQGDLEYRNNSEGDFAAYSGEEVILQNGKQIYWAKYLGGLVDQRASDAD